MAWLRVDDGFTKHPKFEGWPPKDRWAWLETMEYCARYETGGRIPTDFALLPRSTTPALLARAEQSRWCERGEDGALWIRNWEEFNPPRRTQEELEQAIRDALADDPEASANDLVRVIGGQRKAVLAAIRRFQTGSRTGSEVVPKSGSGTETGTGSGTGYARAFPSRPPDEVRGGQGTNAPGRGPAAQQAAPTPHANGTTKTAYARARNLVERVGHEYPNWNVLADEIRTSRDHTGKPHYPNLTDHELEQLEELHAAILDPEPTNEHA